MTRSSTTSGELEKPQSGSFVAGVGRGVARPDDGAVAGVERVDDAGRAERVDATVAERRRRARTGAGVRLPEPRRVAVSPHRLAGGHVVAGDDLVFAALLLRVEEVAVDRERRPARSDRPAPQLDRRRLRPVGLDPHAANDAVAIRSAKAGPFGSLESGSLTARRLLPSPPATANCGSADAASAVAASGSVAASSALPWSRPCPAGAPPPCGIGRRLYFRCCRRCRRICRRPGRAGALRSSASTATRNRTATRR